jgi:arylsulfatase A-like enzyme
MEAHQWKRWWFEKSYPERDPKVSRPQVLESYLAAVERTDSAIGDLLAKWADVRGMDESVVVFLSDHGEQLLDPGVPLALGHGNSMSDFLLRLPLLIRYPAHPALQPGVVDLPVSVLDVAPTLLDLVGTEPPGMAVDGRSLLQVDRDTGQTNRYFFADFQLYGRDLSSVRRDSFKLTIDIEEGHSILENVDTGERLDPESHPELYGDLIGAFRAYVEQARAAAEGLRSEDVIDQQEARRQLEALGHLE